MLRAAIYARYSSDNQTFASIEAQVEQCREYCQRKGYVVVKVYTDEAKSGTTTVKRDNYKLMLADARKDLYDIIIMHKIDRNARCEYDYYCFKSRVLSLGKTYAYAAQGFDISTPEGQLMENNLVGFAAYFSRNLGGEIKKGQRVKAEKAVFLGGKPPLGYKVENHQYVIDEAEAPTVKLIFSMYNEGNSYTDIINRLNKAGLKTKAGKDFGKNSLHDILANQRYTGVYTFGRTIKINGRQNTHRDNPNMVKLPDAVPAIISQDTFQRAQIRMAKHKLRPGAAKADYLLSGMVVCGECGQGMSGNSYGKGRGQVRYYSYICNRQKNHGVHSCTNHRIEKEELESTVIKALVQNITPANIDNIVRKAEAQLRQRDSAANEHIKALAAKRAGAEAKLNNLYSLIETGVADNFDLQRIASVKKEILGIRQEQDECEAQQNIHFNKEDFVKYWQKFKEALQKKDAPKKIRSILENIIESVVVTKDLIQINVALQYSFRMVALKHEHSKTIMTINVTRLAA